VFTGVFAEDGPSRRPKKQNLTQRTRRTQRRKSRVGIGGHQQVLVRLHDAADGEEQVLNRGFTRMFAD
jgi:hypothetical protein